MTEEIYQLAVQKGRKPIEQLAKMWTNGDINKLGRMNAEEFDRHYDELCDEEARRINNNIDDEESKTISEIVTFFSNMFYERLIESGELENDE